MNKTIVIAFIKSSWDILYKCMCINRVCLRGVGVCIRILYFKNIFMFITLYFILLFTRVFSINYVPCHPVLYWIFVRHRWMPIVRVFYINVFVCSYIKYSVVIRPSCYTFRLIDVRFDWAQKKIYRKDVSVFMYTKYGIFRIKLWKNNMYIVCMYLRTAL